MKFTLEVESGDAAFVQAGARHETARILREVANAVEEGYNEFTLRDINGNRVGTATLDTGRVDG